MINTSLCYIENNDEYLMLHRVKKENDLNHDKWIGLGGKFEKDESPEECMLREVYEESSLRLTSWQYRGIVTFVSEAWPTEYMHLFTADAFEGVPGPCSEGELEWIKKSELMKLTLWEGDKIFLRLLEEKAPFFSLKLKYDKNDVLKYAALNGEKLNSYK